MGFYAILIALVKSLCYSHGGVLPPPHLLPSERHPRHCGLGASLVLQDLLRHVAFEAVLFSCFSSTDV